MALADAREGNRPLMLAHREVNHGSDCKTAFGGQTHVLAPVAMTEIRGFLIILLEYTKAD